MWNHRITGLRLKAVISCAGLRPLGRQNLYHMIQDQLVRGITDHEILADLLGDEKTDRSTTEIVDFISRKEQAEAEHSTVCGETPVTAAVTPGATPRRGARPCRGCDGPDHGGRSQRISDCPARNVTCDRCSVKGHYTKNCIKCKDCQQGGVRFWEIQTLQTGREEGDGGHQRAQQQHWVRDV